MNKTRLFILGLAVASLLTSCKKDNNNSQGNRISFNAYTEERGKGDRTYFDPVDDSHGKVKWMEGDLIKVANGNGEQLVFEIAEGKDTDAGTFYADYQGEPEGFLIPNYYAIYPATNEDDEENSIDANGIATFILPSHQTLEANEHPGSFANKAMPMVAHSNNETLPFKNVLGGLVIPLAQEDNFIHITHLKLTSLDYYDLLWGTFTADCNSDEPVLTHVSGGCNRLELSCDVTLTSEPYDFVFMVPPGSLIEGFTVEAYDDDDNRVYYEEFDWATVENGFEIPRTTLMKVQTHPEFNIKWAETVSPTYISTNSAWAMGFLGFPDNTESCGFVYAKASDLTDPMELTSDFAQANTVPCTKAEYFETALTGLEEDEIYYVRAYCVDGNGNYHYAKSVIPFATRYDYIANNNGMSRSSFNVGTETLLFSMGNLQYKASNNTWRIAEYQFEFVGMGEYAYRGYNDRTTGNVYANGQHPHAIGDIDQSDNNEVADNYDRWIDLFYWGTSNYDHGAVCYQPWSTSTGIENYYAYGDPDKNLYDSDGTADWGYNSVSNCYNTLDYLRTLTGGCLLSKDDGEYHPECDVWDGEWNYLLNERSESRRFLVADLRVRGDFRTVDEGFEERFELKDPYNNPDDICHSCMYKVPNRFYCCGIPVGGMIIFPDDFDWNVFDSYFFEDETYPAEVVGWDVGTSWNELDSPPDRCFTEAEWSLLEKFGAVFLPMAGWREGSEVDLWDDRGYYWSSSAKKHLSFYGTTSSEHGDNLPAFDSYAISVRLVGKSQPIY